MKQFHLSLGISNLFIHRPVMTTLVMLGILLFGVLGYNALPVSDLPNVDYPSISVSANLPGASPETMASAVASPLERQFSGIAGIDSISSQSSQGSTQITMQFALNRDIDAAAQDVQTAISSALAQLPPGMPSPPSMRKVNPADAPILFMVVSSPVLPLTTVNEYAETVIAQQISMVKGVAQVQVFAPQKFAIRVQIDPHELQSRGIGIDEVTSAIRRGNVNLPVGSIYGADQSLTLQANGQLNDSKEYQQLIVAYRNGAPVRLKDVATVIDGVENDKNAGWFNGTRSFTMAVQRQPGTNTIEVVDKIKQLLPGLQEQLPASVRLDILNDRSAQIRESVHDVQFTLMLTVGLVVMVIFLFLRNVRATIIPSLSLPVSILATFAVMYVLGFSLNNLSLMALTLCVGFVVDDAIVVLENIVRRMDLGEPPRTAALNGAREVGFTVVSMTISLVAVFIPILFMGGILGRLFKEFAVTISLAILFSGLVSLSLTPMLCSRYLRPTAEHNQSWFYRLTEKIFDGVLKVYSRSLRIAMNFGKTTLTLALILVGVTGWIFTQVPKGFIPNDDYGFIFGSTEGIQGISFEEMKKIQEQVVAIVRQDPNVEAVSSNVGAGGRNSTSNSGSMFVKLKPLKNRKVSSEQFINQIRPKLAKVAGVRVFLFNPPAIRIGGISSRSVYQATLQGTDIAQLNAAAQQLERKMRGIKELQDVTSDLENRNPELEVTIDRKQAAAYNLSVEQIQSALNDAFGTRQISTIYTESNEYQVIAELKPEFQRDIESVTLLPIRSSTGKLVPLGAVASVHESVGPLIINHVGQLTSVTISFGLRPDISLSQGTALIRQASNGLLPADVTLSFQGTAQVFEESMKNLNWLLLIAVLVIYLVLGILYESFIHPFTILSGLPSAGMGALLTLLLFKQELNVYGFVGLIMLIGIVKKNAIMMIDFALETQRSSVSSPEEAIYLACVVRFRPIMMTTMAALMGTLPIALGFGASAQARRSLGLAVVGGLVVSQVLTLYLTPVVYVALERLKVRFGYAESSSTNLFLLKTRSLPKNFNH